jgi:hypothetical protein
MKEEILYSILQGHFVFYSLLRFRVGEKEVTGLKGCDTVYVYIFGYPWLIFYRFLTYILFIYVYYVCCILSTTEARELARYKFDLAVVQEVRLGKGGTVRAWGLHFLLWKRKRKLIENRFFLFYHRIVSPLREKSLLVIGYHVYF